MGAGFSREHFAEKVREVRKRVGLSQAALAEAVGVSTETISRIERAAFEASLSTACAMAAALQVSLDELVGDGDAPKGRQPARSAVVERLVERVEQLPSQAQRALLQLAQLIPPKE